MQDFLQQENGVPGRPAFQPPFPLATGLFLSGI